MKTLLAYALGVVGLRMERTGGGIMGRAGRAGSADRRYQWIKDMNIRTVIDVGAHQGEFALQLHRLFPQARIYSFEPLQDCFEKLNARMRGVPQFRSFNLALGDSEGSAQIHRSEFSASSSFLKMGQLHKQAFPFSAGETLETVRVNTLDNIAETLDLEDNVLLKVDVQGFENRVIAGGRTTLRRVRIAIVETSFHRLYEGQPLFSEIHGMLAGFGLIYSGSWGELKSPSDGLPLQQDGIFVRW